MDHPNDITFLESEKTLQEFGYRNADAIARYFGLSAKDGSIDNSDYAPLAVPTPSTRVSQDYTKPVYTQAELIVSDRFRHYATFQISSLEQESYLQYYSYSLDDGLTWSTYYPWDRKANNMTILVKYGCNQPKKIIFQVFNQYDLGSISNPVMLY